MQGIQCDGLVYSLRYGQKIAYATGLHSIQGFILYRASLCTGLHSIRLYKVKVCFYRNENFYASFLRNKLVSTKPVELIGLHFHAMTVVSPSYSCKWLNTHMHMYLII